MLLSEKRRQNEVNENTKDKDFSLKSCDVFSDEVTLDKKRRRKRIDEIGVEKEYLCTETEQNVQRP